MGLAHHAASQGCRRLVWAPFSGSLRLLRSTEVLCASDDSCQRKNTLRSDIGLCVCARTQTHMEAVVKCVVAYWNTNNYLSWTKITVSRILALKSQQISLLEEVEHVGDQECTLQIRSSQYKKTHKNNTCSAADRRASSCVKTDADVETLKGGGGVS